MLARSAKAAKESRRIAKFERRLRVPSTRILNDIFDLVTRPAERLPRIWEASGDIIERSSKKPVARLYGRGNSSSAAEEEVQREAERWLINGGRTRW
jgi:hypothetical protein